MRKAISWILVFVVLASFASAITANTSRPTLVLEYDELVKINEYLLVDGLGNEYELDKEPDQDFASTYSMRPPNVLRNGNFVLTLNVSDQLDNQVEHLFTFSVDAPLTIELIEPEFAHANATGYTIVVDTSVEAHCGRSLLEAGGVNESVAFTSDTLSGPNATYSYYHNITNAPFANQLVWFKCRDRAGTEAKQDYYFTVDGSPPEFLSGPDFTPDPLVDPSRKISNLNFSLTDPSVCWLEGTIDGIDERIILGDGDPEKSSTYKTDFTRDISYGQVINTSRNEFVYNITCVNLAKLETQASKTLVVELSEDFTITVTSPERYTDDTTPELIVTTDIITSCVYKKANLTSWGTMSGGGTAEHKATLGTLSEGDHEYDIKCDSASKTEETSYTFTIDNAAPTNVSIIAEGGACSLTRLSADFEATDASGIAYFNYSIKKGTNYIVNTTKTTSSSVSYQNLELTSGSTYTWNMVAVDKLGNKKAATAVSVKAEDGSSNLACDTFRPSITFQLTDASGGKDVKVTCTDDSSGCESTYNYSIVATNEVCGAPQGSKQMTQSVYVPFNSNICVWASDKNGNVAFKKETITDTTAPPVADADNDGVPDDQDDCPTERGTLANNGCAEDPGDEFIDPLNPGDGGGSDTANCGNSRIDANEDCDRTNMGGYTLCDDLGLPGGRLSCTADCRYDTSQCTDISGDFDPEGSKGKGFAITLIIIGIILALLGGGYLGFEKYYGPGIGTSRKFPGRPGPGKPGAGSAKSAPGRPASVVKQRPVFMRPRTQAKQPSLDQIREMERKKILADEAKKKRQSQRDKLFKQFDKNKK